MKATNIRSRASFVDHIRLHLFDVANSDLPISNVAYKSSCEADMWIEEATGKIGDWRSLSRSVYLRWALTINASELAEKTYRGRPAGIALATKTLRVTNGSIDQVELAVWPASEAADRYADITPLIAAYGVADLFGALEDVIFQLYEVFLAREPALILKGDEFRSIRKLLRQRMDSPAARNAWEQAWTLRIEEWRRKKAYRGLHNVLLAFFQHADLRRASCYKATDVTDWCRTLEMIGELRHHVVHGASTVSDRLGQLSNTETSLTFDFVAGQQLTIKLHHLQSTECFFDQLLTAINLSLLEKAVGPVTNQVSD